MKKLMALITLLGLTGCVYNKTVNDAADCSESSARNELIEAVQIKDFFEPYEAEL